MEAAAAPQEPRQISKRLASCSASVRRRAIRDLTLSPSLSDGELVKIWKGLFFCFWHSDKSLEQSSLASRLASFVSATEDTSLSLRFLDAFLLTLRREWPGIDSHRLNKFYLLSRRFLYHSFQLLKSHCWAEPLVSRLLSVYADRALLLDKFSTSRGVGYHVADSFLDELHDFLPLPADALDALLKPFFAVLATARDKVMVQKVKGSVFDRLVENGEKVLEILKDGKLVEDGNSAGYLGQTVLLMAPGLGKRFFELAASEGMVQANRKVMFSLHKSFLKLHVNFERSGVMISAPVLENGSATSVPGLEELDDGLPNKQKKQEFGDGQTKDVKDKKVKKKKQKKNKIISGNETGADAEETEATVEMDSAGIGSGKTLDGITLDEVIFSNLQKQFEMAAAEAGLAAGSGSLVVSKDLHINGKAGKKRKQAMIAGKQETDDNGCAGASPIGSNCHRNCDGGASAEMDSKSREANNKKVRFSVKNNLVWKPNSPLPPQSLRIPPSVTPRGSALKKGVPPGPVKQTKLGMPRTKSAKVNFKKGLKRKIHSL